ncbi:phosphotransferase [Cognatilysobacter terrigena]|uniref:phosphotransferase n=1 Tax=Cognatilysobacter terrigena TaxID=2488749 RepID=UPI00105FFDB1|nr:phosphotransferase [Lysobacter terrigena]
MTTLPQTREDITRLIPHQGRMCLWQRVVEADARRIVVQAFDHGDAGHPLRHRDRLHAVHLAEYGAQAMAVHGGLRGRDAGLAPRPGLLVALRGVVLHRDRIDDLDGPLDGEAEVLVDSETGAQYAFVIRHCGATIAEGRAAVIHPPA